MKTAAVLLAPGFEEIEAVTVLDVLRRAEIDVVALGTRTKIVHGSHGIALEADALLAHAPEPSAYDAVILPGGMPGAAHLRDDDDVLRLVREQHAAGRVLAAICAGPIAFGHAGILRGLKATCYPGFEDQLQGAHLMSDDVVCDGHVVTSRGPGTALCFALTLVEMLAGPNSRRALAERMLTSS